VVTVPAPDMARLLTALRDEFGGSVEDLLAAARASLGSGGRRRRAPEVVPFRTATEVQEAVRMRLITREEARRLLGLRATATRRRRPAVVVGSVPQQVAR
jgi:hypothetical protein